MTRGGAHRDNKKGAPHVPQADKTTGFCLVTVPSAAF